MSFKFEEAGSYRGMTHGACGSTQDLKQDREEAADWCLRKKLTLIIPWLKQSGRRAWSVVQ